MIKTQKSTTKKASSLGFKLVPGNLITCKITASGPNNVGINEFSFGMPVLVPNAKLGETVQAQILKISTKHNVAIAKLVTLNPNGLNEGFKGQRGIRSSAEGNSKTGVQAGLGIKNGVSAPSLKAGDVLDVIINKYGPNATGISELDNTYQNIKKVIVDLPLAQKGAKAGKELNVTFLNQKVSITVTRVKKSFAFGIINNTNPAVQSPQEQTPSYTHTGVKVTPVSLGINNSGSVTNIYKDTKFTVVLPSTPKGGMTKKLNVLESMLTPLYPNVSEGPRGVGLKRVSGIKHMVLKLSNGLNPLKGINPTFVPDGLSSFDRGLAVNSLENLLLNSVSPETGVGTSPKGIKSLPSNTLLFVKPRLGAKSGDKVQIQITRFIPSNENLKYNICIAKIQKLNPMSVKNKKVLVKNAIRNMVLSGMHYGENSIKCNARMKSYVWIRKKGKNANKPLVKKGRNIINLLKTRRCLNKALAQLAKFAVKGKTFLFVGTKKAAAGLVSRASLFSKNAFFVNTRWLGGMLTNWKTIKKSISKIRPILKEKQIIIKDILEKRQSIKGFLIQKALLLRKKSKLLLKKGRQLIKMLQTKNGGEFRDNQTYIQKTQNLNLKRKNLISKGVLLLQKHQGLVLKRQELLLQSQNVVSKAKSLTGIYLDLLNNLNIARKKGRELKALLLLCQETEAFKLKSLDQNQNLYTASYDKFRSLNATSLEDKANAFISHPPKEILNKMVSVIKGQALIFKKGQQVSSGDQTADSSFEKNLNLKNVNGSKVLILSQLLSKFSLFVPTIKASIKNLQSYSKTLLASLNKVKALLNVLKQQMAKYVNFKKNILSELRQIKQTAQIQRAVIRVLKRKYKQISAQKRLIKFLPKLSYLPTPTQKIEQTARFLMKKFVDPKMKYPMDWIYDQKLSGQSKKVSASRKKKWERLEKYFGGISKLPLYSKNKFNKDKDVLGAQTLKQYVAIIIGQQEDINAVRECQKLGIKMFHIVDTNCNPGFADHFVPANDDARTSIKFVLAKFLTRIRLAQKLKNKFRKNGLKVRSSAFTPFGS
jgi:ribosomal protein S2